MESVTVIFKTNTAEVNHSVTENLVEPRQQYSHRAPMLSGPSRHYQKLELMRSGVHSALWTLFYLSVWHATNLDFGLAKQQVDSMYVIPTRPLWPTQPTLCTVYVYQWQRTAHQSLKFQRASKNQTKFNLVVQPCDMPSLKSSCVDSVGSFDVCLL